MGVTHRKECIFVTSEKRKKTVEVKVKSVKRLFMKKKKTVSLLKSLVQVKKTHNVHIMFYSQTITEKHNYSSEMIHKKRHKNIQSILTR